MKTGIKKDLTNLKGHCGGPKPKLSQQQKEQLLDMLKEKDCWTTAQIKQLIKEKFNVEYSDVHIRRLLRAFGMLYIKPYPIDYRRPKNAREYLYTTLSEVIKAL